MLRQEKNIQRNIKSRISEWALSIYSCHVQCHSESKYFRKKKCVPSTSLDKWIPQVAVYLFILPSGAKELLRGSDEKTNQITAITKLNSGKYIIKKKRNT